MVLYNLNVLSLTVELLTVNIILTQSLLHPFYPLSKSLLICTKHCSHSEKEVIELICWVEILKVWIHKYCTHYRSFRTLTLNWIRPWSSNCSFSSWCCRISKFIWRILWWSSFWDSSVSRLFFIKKFINIIWTNWFLIIFIKL